jgi:hypothetical protein
MRRPALLPALLLAALVGTFVASSASAQRLVFSTENDLFTNESSKDDLYTFAVGIGFELGEYAVTLRENAFTDRAAGIRFDETYLSMGRALRLDGPWTAAVEAGIARRGHGLFGESVQNAVHRTIGGEEVHLDYLEEGYHFRLAFEAERTFAVSDSVDWGPRFQADLAPGLRSWVVAAAGATWRPGGRLAVEALLGARATETTYDPLEPHLSPLATTARLGIVWNDRFFVAWSYNDLGDEREHLSAGYRVPLGDRATVSERAAH